ncbi:MAG: efflux RND transporter periplasmic adaptor subunit [Proteobacteria bacterium]|nr:efflux RND transporter periplasmic adaptor subunit [Pseudomonadota bacterium]
MKSKARVAIIPVFLLVALGVIGVLTYKNRAPVSETGLIQEVATSRHPVQTLIMQPEVLVERLVSTGVLVAEQDVILTAEVAGKVKKVFKALGDPCKKGALLLRLDAENYQIVVDQAKAALKQSKISLDHAERELKRMQVLKQSAVITAQQLDGAEGVESSARVSVEQAEAALRLAQRNLRETNVRCPFSGSVAERMVDTGQAVIPQTPLARLVDTDRLKLVLSVTSGEISRLKVGQAVVLTDPALPDRSYSGTVSRVGVAADSITRNFPVEVLIKDKEKGLRSGQVVHATLNLEEHRDVLAVPIEAVMTKGGGESVFVILKNKARQVAVGTGPQIDEKVTITSGLKLGDEVIIVGGDNLEDDFVVEVVKGRR